MARQQTKRSKTVVVVVVAHVTRTQTTRRQCQAEFKGKDIAYNGSDKFCYSGKNFRGRSAGVGVTVGGVIYYCSIEKYLFVHLGEPSRGQGDCWLNFGAPMVVKLPPACSQAHAAGSKNRKSQLHP